MEAADLTGASEALFIPLLGKAQVARYGDILHDPKAAEIVAAVDYDFSQNGQSRFLAIYMGIRAAILDQYARDFIAAHPDGIVLHLGCGLDARAERVGPLPAQWVDVDLPDVISVRRRFYEEGPGYRMLGASVVEPGWLEELAWGSGPVLVVAEGLTMYLTDEENQALFRRFREKFSRTEYVFDAYSKSAVAWSKRKNPVNRMGAVIRWGLDEPGLMEAAVPGVRHVETRYFTDRQWSDRLSGWTRTMFRLLYGNAWANSLYRIYRFEIQKGRTAD